MSKNASKQFSKKKLTLITGATSGIGLALITQLEDDHDLIVVGRKKLNDLPSDYPKITKYIQTDISNIDMAVADIVNQIGDVKIDHLIHCAGSGYYKAPQDETFDEISQIVSINLLFPIRLTHALASQLADEQGKVTFIGSVAHKGAPNMASYAATKAGLHGFARALRSEWAGKIDIQILHPGPTLTPIFEKAGYKPGFEKILFLKAETTAKEIARLIQTNRFSATIFLRARIKQLLFGSRA